MEDSIKKELFIKTVREWQSIKANSSKRIWELTQKVKSPLIVATLDIMKQDAVRHRVLLQIIIDTMEGKGDSVDLKELADLSSTLREHLAVESRMIHLASHTSESSHQNIVQYITSFIISDEKKNNEMMNKLLSLAEVKT